MAITVTPKYVKKQITNEAGQPYIRKLEVDFECSKGETPLQLMLQQYFIDPEAHVSVLKCNSDYSKTTISIVGCGQIDLTLETVDDEDDRIKLSWNPYSFAEDGYQIFSNWIEKALGHHVWPYLYHAEMTDLEIGINLGCHNKDQFHIFPAKKSNWSVHLESQIYGDNRQTHAIAKIDPQATGDIASIVDITNPFEFYYIFTQDELANLTPNAQAFVKTIGNKNHQKVSVKPSEAELVELLPVLNDMCKNNIFNAQVADTWKSWPDLATKFLPA